MVALAHWLSPDKFGEYQLVMSLVFILPIVVDWGISNSLARYLSHFRGLDPGLVRPALSAGIRIKLVALIVGGTILIAAKEPLVVVFRLDSITPLLPVGFLILLGLSCYDFFLKLSEGFQRFETIPMVTFLRNTSDVVLSLGLVLLGYGVLGALLGKLVATWLAAGVGLTWLMRSVHRQHPAVTRMDSGIHRKLITYGSWLVLIDVADRVFMFGDRLLINRLLGPEMVGLYSVPARLAALSQMVGLSVASVLGPAMGKDPKETEPALRAGLRILLALYALVAVLTLGLADRIVLTVFGDDYSMSIPSLRVYALIIPLMGLSPVFSLVLNYSGVANRRVVFIATATAITVVGNVVLIPLWGILGSALAMGAGQLFYVVAQGSYCSRFAALHGFWPPLLAKVSAISLGSAAGIFLIRYFIPGNLAAWGAGAIVSIGFVTALFRWGVIGRTELQRFLPGTTRGQG